MRWPFSRVILCIYSGGQPPVSKGPGFWARFNSPLWRGSRHIQVSLSNKPCRVPPVWMSHCSVGIWSGAALPSRAFTTGRISGLGQYLPASLPDSGQINRYSWTSQISVGAASVRPYSVMIWSGGQLSPGSKPEREQMDICWIPPGMPLAAGLFLVWAFCSIFLNILAGKPPP